MTYRPYNRFAALAICAGLLVACSSESPPAEPAPAAETAQPAAPPAGPLVIEASRPPQMMIPVLDAWRSETGGQFELAAQDEAGSGADIVIHDSLADTWDVAEADELRPVFSDTITRNIDGRLRDSESRWVGLSKRARVIVYNPATVGSEELATLDGYEALRDDLWRERLCLSSSDVGGNRLLVARLLARHGAREAELIVRAWRENFARQVLVDDASLLEAIADGSCAIGIADSNDAVVTDGVSIHWFERPAATLVDITAAGVSRHASDADMAAALLEWLTEPTPNALFAIQDLELPANGEAPAGNLVSDHVSRLSEPDSLSNLGFLIEEADLLVERARYR